MTSQDAHLLIVDDDERIRSLLQKFLIRQGFFVSADEIRRNRFDLSINRYKEFVYTEERFDPPKEVIQKLKLL